MAKYTHISGAVFPDALMIKQQYKDAVDAPESDLNKLLELKNIQLSGNYGSAKEYLTNNPALKDYIFTAESINRIVEELRNAQIYAKSVSQQIYYQEEKPMEYFSTGDIWISTKDI